MWFLGDYKIFYESIYCMTMYILMLCGHIDLHEHVLTIINRKGVCLCILLNDRSKIWATTVCIVKLFLMSSVKRFLFKFINYIMWSKCWEPSDSDWRGNFIIIIIKSAVRRPLLDTGISHKLPVASVRTGLHLPRICGPRISW